MSTKTFEDHFHPEPILAGIDGHELPGKGAGAVEPFDLTQWSTARFQGEPPPTRYLVQDFIPAGIAGTIYSPGGTGKSTLALDLSIRIAVAGEPGAEPLWLGRFPVVQPGRVLYYSGEEPEDVLHKRLVELVRVVADDTGLTEHEVRRAVDERLSLVNVWGKAEQLFKVTATSLEPTETYHRVFETVRRADGVALVCFDTRSRLSGAEGSGNGLVSREVSFYEHLAAELGPTVLILHHTNKASYTAQGNAQGAIRGESAFLDCLRFGMHLQAMGSEDAAVYSIPESERHKYLVVTNSKQNYAEVQGPLVLRRERYRFTLTDLQPRPSKEAQRAADEERNIQVVVEIVKANPQGISQRGVIEAAKGKVAVHKVREALQSAEALEMLQSEPGDKRATIYRPVQCDSATAPRGL